MSDVLAILLPALDVAAFARAADGSFRPLAPPPAWFPRLADATFPFLGHILDEANQFWRSGAAGSREFGPCEETDASGRPFHYRVRAIATAGGAQFLVFELDTASEEMRATLQKARDQALGVEKDRARQGEAAARIRRAGTEVLDAAQQVSATATAPQLELLDVLRARVEALMQHVRDFAG